MNKLTRYEILAWIDNTDKGDRYAVRCGDLDRLESDGLIELVIDRVDITRSCTYALHVFRVTDKGRDFIAKVA